MKKEATLVLSVQTSFEIEGNNEDELLDSLEKKKQEIIEELSLKGYSCDIEYEDWDD